jgi:transposase
MKKSPNKERVIGVAEAAKRLGAAPSTVRGWVAEGRFPGARLEASPGGGISFWLIPENTLYQFKRPKIGRPSRTRIAPLAKKITGIKKS